MATKPYKTTRLTAAGILNAVRDNDEVEFCGEVYGAARYAHHPIQALIAWANNGDLVKVVRGTGDGGDNKTNQPEQEDCS